MSNLIQSSAIESALIQGDLKALTPDQRVSYYKEVCASVGLNPLTKPFEYIVLNSKLTLYAKRDATDQLRKIHKVSISITSREKFDDVYVVTAKAKDASGREDESTGAVSIAGLKGESLANAFLKAETKAKRRVTLSFCGMGLLDESEVQDIPAEAKRPLEVTDEPPFDPSEEEEKIAADPGEYAIKFGKHNGRKLNTINPPDLMNYMDWIEKNSKNDNKPLSPLAAEFIEHANAYLKENR